MDHNEAIRLMGTELYLLNELSPELREQFEEHFFECPECANDVRAGALFLEQTKAILAADAAAPQREIAPSKSEKQSSWAWLRPSVAVPHSFEGTESGASATMVAWDSSSNS